MAILQVCERSNKGKHENLSFLCIHAQDFEEVFFPQMTSLCGSAKGDALLLLTRNADVFAARLPRDPVTRVILPLLCRAADQGARILCLTLQILAYGFWRGVGNSNERFSPGKDQSP